MRPVAGHPKDKPKVERGCAVPADQIDERLEFNHLVAPLEE